jgi:hypothetical protein
MRRHEETKMARTGTSAPGGNAERRPRQSEIYRLLWKAIRARKLVACVYDGCFRETCPHILGYTKDGAEALFVFQFGGESTSELPPGGDWRCFELAGMTEVRLCEGRWRSGARHSQPQGCIQFVDVDVNLPGTLKRRQPLSFGSPELRPPRRSGG